MRRSAGELGACAGRVAAAVRWAAILATRCGRVARRRTSFTLFRRAPAGTSCRSWAPIRRQPTHNFDFASLGLLPTGTVGPTDVVLSTGDFNYDFTPAGRLLVGHTFNECLQIEGVYFGVSQGDNTAAVRDNTPNAHGRHRKPLLAVRRLRQHSHSRLGFQQLRPDPVHFVALRRRAEHPPQGAHSPPGKLTTSILFGVRYMGLPEDFHYNTNSDITKARHGRAERRLEFDPRRDHQRNGRSADRSPLRVLRR